MSDRPAGHFFPGWLRAGAVLAAVWLAPGLAAAEPDDDLRQAKVILNRWADALGGAWQIAELKTMDYRCQLHNGPGQPPVEIHLRARADGAYRYDFELANIGRLTQAFDGRFTWQRNDLLGFGQLTPDVHRANQGGADFRLMLRTAADFPKRRRLPDETIGGRLLQVVEMAGGPGGRAKWYFDPATGLRVRLEASDQTGRLVVENSDFRPVHGVKEPFKIRRTFNGQTVEIDVDAIVYNEDIDPELFAAPLGLVEDNQQVERVLADNRQASGYAALGQLRTRRTKALVEITTSGMKMPTVISQKQPNLIVTEQETPGMGPVWQGYNGHVGWAWSELQGYRTMEGAELQQLIGNADMQGPLRLSVQCPFRRWLGEQQDGDRRLTGIALASLQGVAGNFWFDTRTKELVRVETFVQAGPSGQLKVVADFSDFRRVDGVLMPFRTVITNPAMRVVTTIESVQHNLPLDDAIFQPKKE